MRIFDFEKIFFRVNVALVAVIFIFLTPTTQIIASWFPGKKDILWAVPAGVLTLCSALWIALKLALPSLIRRGIFEDRRGAQREEAFTPERFRRLFLPVLIFFIQGMLLILMTMCLISFLRGEVFFRLFTNLP